MIGNSHNRFNYFAYGFQLCSTFAIPELLHCKPENDDVILIQYALISDIISHPVYENDAVQVSPTMILIDIDQVARFKIENGNRIDIHPYEGVTDKEIRLYLIGSALEAIIFQRRILPLHGSAIIHKQQAYIFSGASGCGKSTLAAWFVKNGYAMLTDDVCTITMDEHNRARVHPGYPRLKLWSDAIARLGKTFSADITDRHAIMKHSIPLHHEFNTNPVYIKGIYFIDSQPVNEIQILKLARLEYLELLDSNIFRINLYHNNLSCPKYNNYKTALGKIPVVRKVIRPEYEFDMETIFKSIENDMLNFKYNWL